MATVEFTKANKAYKAKKHSVHAVTDFDLQVDDGQFVVLVGPSGCGKTTVLRLLAGLEELTSGHIRIGARVVDRVAPKDRDVAMVFQNYALYPHMTVFDNMAFGLKMRRVPKAEIKSKVNDVAAMLGLDQLLGRKPAALSGGEQQRVAVGRAIVRRPQVFLFDEPLSNLDALQRVRMRTEIKQRHRQLQTTTIYVTHDQEEAMTLGDRLVIMRDGVIQQVGAPLDVYRRPANRFVAGFIGMPTMNFFEGQITKDNGMLSFVGDVGRLPLPCDMTEAMHACGTPAVTLGLRPEHVRVGVGADRADQSRDASPAMAKLDATVMMVEPLGETVNVHLEGADGVTIVARATLADSIRAGQGISLDVDMRNAHVFNPDDGGMRLNASPAAPTAAV